MTATAPAFIVDADVFISAKNQYYAFDICPGFWRSLIYHGESAGVRSIDKVRSELLRGRKTEDLVQWVENDLPADFFYSTDDADVLSSYAQVMLWVQRHVRYFDSAKAKFATEADGWLVAYAMTYGQVVITNEQPRPEARNRILLPDVCNQFGVTWGDTFWMLKRLGVRFEWARPA